MHITLLIYKDSKGFYSYGRYRTFLYQMLEYRNYETLSLVAGSYTNDDYDVDPGEVLEEGDERGKKLLQLYDTLNDELVWADITKEDFIDFKELNKMPKVVVNNYINTGGGGGNGSGGGGYAYTDAWTGPAESLSSQVFTGIGSATSLLIIQGDTALTEWNKGVAFSLADLPVGDTYKIDAVNNELYFGKDWLFGQRLFIGSDKQLTIV